MLAGGLPTPPVMPWTMTLLSAVKKIAISVLSGARGLGGSDVGGFIHRAYFRHQWVVGLGQDATALVDVVAVEPDHQRLVGFVAEDLQRLDDAVGNGVACRDATEHVDEH